MRIAVVGGGPAGLYFALLMKRDWPELTVDVFERNQPDDTFGFGVVFSDQTLDTFKAADAQSYAAIRDNFAYWDDIEIHFKGDTFRVPGNGFCGCSRRSLLMLVQARARELGVNLHFGSEVADAETLKCDYDLVVGADGINSRIRENWRERFQPQTDLRPNHFTWMGSTRPFDAFTFFFKETEHGVFIAHCYQYEAGRSTWVLETDPETFAKAGLGAMDEAQSAAFLERVFAEELEGHKLITNRSLWRNFPMIRCRHWVIENVVLIGDAKATAHFSIGSGTKLAMEDAIALHKAMGQAKLDVAAGLKLFETQRREEVEKTQHAADVSLVWFEELKRFWDFEPLRFAFGLMTRSKAITYDNLALRAPEMVEAVDRLVADGLGDLAKRRKDGSPVPPAFQPFKLREMRVENRMTLSPMCQYSAEDGLPGDWHLMHYGSRAIGGPGLIFTEMTCVAPDARITPGCTGLWNDEQEAAWKRITTFVHANSAAKICLQLGHAGRKGATKLMWEGMDRPLPEGAWPIISASPLPYYPESQVPRAMTRADMDRVKAEFVAAAERGERAGFDMLELHCAHGYLLASFLSPLTNKRTDEYGGSVENRLRYPLEIFRALREAWPRVKPMSVRISATDWVEGGLSAADSVAIAEAFATEGCDLVDVSTGQTARESRPVYGRMFQTPFSDRIRNEAEVATMCVGNITTADQVNTIIAAGRADLVALGRPHLADPSFVLRAAAWYGVDADQPVQYGPGKDQLMRNTPRERQDLEELKLKAKPSRHALAK
ncbi:MULTISPECIES: bifunctional salicylyl-CoA 5-hydroxylase/oxidoreductase [Bosea]|uniref:bifunctional salicylyl-CoA 5-hydroxylase/oxidoreductase n=1 Tax=Bosea TaxID=85413 RepID=UPI00214FF91F|nr:MULTISPECIES: bifunctional salicylyl-CoA 5-hydroxylase/oxidoreductase [Bosea]MCR4520537.1 bifunctional salicylyl-CoA 5-hydroxylase/oxidoreductase [Bosea sp. 47.2.35]MDR6827891.1 anthraniloyl-CoA monooxygenase [Bosea robiniae]MDR6894415.1 anthraniloyl-CoA monooxygenase [Bosea sp. BE109]MDR7137997.1 anthraniloyl-CoA monooxygenase [Bosea sp. BE168]MDR7174696.1 anthraniloyl-CoA monooxygenase [Bosea sp. BE271]